MSKGWSSQLLEEPEAQESAAAMIDSGNNDKINVCVLTH